MYDAGAERDPFEAFGEAEPTPSVRTGFSWAGLLGGLSALLWIAAAIGGPIAYYGADAVMRMDPALQAGIVALAFGPGLLFWVAASAAGEALKARKLAAELILLARQARAPFEAGGAEARRMGASVRDELEALTDAVANALDRMAELELSAKRNTAMFGETIEASHDSAETLTLALKRECDALADVNAELRGQTDTMANSVGRQVRLMREASKLVKSEMTAADEALRTHITTFADSASMISERTNAFHQAADGVTEATASLNGTMATMLDGLSEATKLSEAARKSSEQAVMAASETAGALRETTRSAVFEAKRAAQLIRAETQTMQQSAAETLAKLKDAANAAQVAASRPAAPKPTPKPAPRAEEIGDLHAAANAALARSRPKVQAHEQERAFEVKSFGSWGNFKPRTLAEETPPTANEDIDLIDFSDPSARLKHHALDLVAEAGVDLDDVLGAGDLARIARCSREGASSRRRAVADAAPGAVTRIARYVSRNEKAHLVANEFRARPDLARGENKAESPGLMRAYLLIDAALA